MASPYYLYPAPCFYAAIFVEISDCKPMFKFLVDNLPQLAYTQGTIWFWEDALSMSKKFLSVRDMCHIALFTALIIVLSLVPFPIPGAAPTTLQTFVIPFAGIVLGARRGGMSALVYILLGAVGLPVWAGFSGGLGILFGLTGGFLFGFPIYAFAAGWGADRGRLGFLICGLLVGMVATYLLGMMQFSLVTGLDLRASFFAVVLPFLPTEGIKLFFACFLGLSVRRRLTSSGVLA